jgi:hypothetical protein
MTIDERPRKALVWAGRVISALVLVPMIISAVMKFKAGPQVVEGMAKVGIPFSLLKTLAVLEITSIVLYAIPNTAVIGAVLLTGYMGGAICTHLRMGESVPIQTLIPILAWFGLYLREPRLHALLPFRK